MAGHLAARGRAGRETADGAVSASLAANLSSSESAERTSVVIVTADSGPSLVDCIASVLASSVAVDVIISDNASSDGSIERVRQRWPNEPRLRIVHNGTNLGFGTGCNRGAAVATGDALFFLNPDCIVETTTIAALRRILDADPSIGVVGATVVAPNGTPDPASRRRDPLLRRAFMSLSGLAPWQSRWPALSGVNFPTSNRSASFESVDAVSGAAMMMPRAMFDEIHGFDERYFLHCEDLDISRRARDHGARVVCANDIRIVHGKGGSSRRRPLFVAWHKHRGMWRWFTTFDPAARNPMLRALVATGMVLHLALMSPVYLLRKALHRQR